MVFGVATYFLPTVLWIGSAARSRACGAVSELSLASEAGARCHARGAPKKRLARVLFFFCLQFFVFLLLFFVFLIFCFQRFLVSFFKIKFFVLGGESKKRQKPLQRFFGH